MVPKGLFCASTLVVVGVLYNRFNVFWTGMLRGSNASYFPSWEEIGISLFLVTSGAVAFFLIAKNFPIFPSLEKENKSHDEVCPLGSVILPRERKLTATHAAKRNVQ